MLKKISLVFLIILTILCITTQVHAEGEEEPKRASIDTVASDAKGFLEAGDPSGLMNEAKIKTASDLVYNTLSIIGGVIAIVVGIILGVKIATAGAEEKAQAKELLVPYFAGVVILFGAFVIWKIVATILQ